MGFYGLDVYSLWESLREVTTYLEGIDLEAARAARQAFVCFQPYDRDVQAYAWATRLVRGRRDEPAAGNPAQASAVSAASRRRRVRVQCRAKRAVGAERYYRTMIRGGPDSWNLRDHHVVDTLERLMQHHGPEAKAIVWEHNTHVGDARATDMAGAGMVNVGQLVRERRSGDGVVLVGFGSHRGSVIAGREWDAPMERMRVPEAREGSYEDLFHSTLGDDRLMILTGGVGEISDVFRRTRGHRAIGVVYNPEALHPLHFEPEPSKEPPETYPWAV